MIGDQQLPTEEAIVDKMEIQELNGLAVKGLVAMFHPEKELFCHRLKLTRQGLVREGLSPRYTLMTLAGLRKGEDFGLQDPFDCRSILAGLLKSPALDLCFGSS
jgi:hypothetical protein